MEKKAHYTLGKKDRLKSRKTIEHLFKEGKSFSIFPFRVIYSVENRVENILQAGFGASTRNFKKAVDRNRIKRLMREAYRLQKEVLNNQNLAVFFIYTGKEIPDYKLVSEKILLCIKRLQKIINEKRIENT
ncbi:MAG: ribonuclease P protein component [Sphingobacteriales bacterium]|nr:ribonuclease P protein component [Sphingobacteriales bacterium]